MCLEQRKIAYIFRRAWVAVAVTLVCCHPSPAPGQTVVFTQIPVAAPRENAHSSAPPCLSERYCDGSRLMLIGLGESPAADRCLSQDFVAATDASVSFDGRRLLFAGRKAMQPWQIFEIDLARSQIRQVVRRKADCLMPAYLPDGEITFASPDTATGASSPATTGQLQALSLYRVQPGGRVSRMCFAPGWQIEPAILNDGRLIYGVGFPLVNLDEGQAPWKLFLVNSDGTGVQGLAGMGARPWLKRSPAVGSGDHIAYIVSDRQHPFASGELRLCSLNEATEEHVVGVDGSVGLVADVSPILPGGSSTPAIQPCWLLSMRPAAGTVFGLYRFDGKTTNLLRADDNWHALRPVLLNQRPRPHIRPSVVDPRLSWGHLICQNVYLTNPDLAEKIPPGSVARVRFLEGLPRIRADKDAKGAGAVLQANPAPSPKSAQKKLVPPPATPVRILGEAPVQSDGSFSAKLPVDRPLRLQLIDQEDFVVVDQKSWFWVRPNESRLCIGCHEDPELSFENVVPVALTKPPVDLTNPARWRRLSFRQHVLPVLSATCGVSECHRPPEPTGGLNFSTTLSAKDLAPQQMVRFGPAYRGLMAAQPGKPLSVGGRLIHPGNPRESPLLWMLYGRQLGHGYQAAPFERQVTEPHVDEELPKGTLSLIRTWIEIGAPYDDGLPGSALDVISHRETKTKAEK